jgi:hypothetical protein
MSLFIKYLRIKLAKKKIALASKLTVRVMNIFMKYKVKK